MSFHSPDPVEVALDSLVAAGTVLAAVSGGPDSMAMFHGLCELARERGDLRVVAAHFDHGLRPDSHRDVETVNLIAGLYGVRVMTGGANVVAHAELTRQSIEAAARELRYAFLERAAGEAGADIIATAHTRSDQHETVVMRMMRGAGGRGLRGIPERRGRIVRPLLAVTHADTVQYCLDHGVPYILDPTNADPRFLRNRIRHEVLPALRKAYRNVDAVLDQIAASARRTFEESERAVSGRLDELRREPDGWSLPLGAFDGLDAHTRVHLLMQVLAVISRDDNVARDHYVSLLGLIDDGPTGKSIDLPEIRVRREHDALVFIRRDRQPEPASEPQVLNVPGSARVDTWALTSLQVNSAEALRDLMKEPVKRPRPDEAVAYISAQGPLTIRFPRPGDRIRPFGMSGYKKLSDLFIDRKIPRRERWRTPVVESNGEILWVVGVALSETARIRSRTASAVRLSATRDEAGA